ncbi:paraquat-inducible protein A [Pseudomonas amygdali]|nr:paraquat-inducible protein A [Pseudomonas amygdali]
MNTELRWIICEHCDCVFKHFSLLPVQRAECTNCGALLDRGWHMNVSTSLAFSITAGLMFIFANTLPLISIHMNGLSNEVTLWKSVDALLTGPIVPIAIVAGFTTILVPLLQILLFCWIFGFALKGSACPFFWSCIRLLEHLRSWSMLEVYMLGILVSIVKLSGMLDVHPGLGLWALAMQSVLLILISHNGTFSLCDSYEERRS